MPLQKDDLLGYSILGANVSDKWTDLSITALNLTANKSARCTAARERIQKQLSHRLFDATEKDMGLKSSSSQTYPGKMELHIEELLTAFQSMESQVLKIVQK